jgi:hypothetical protein
MTEHIGFYLKSLRDFLGSAIPLRATVIDLHPESHDDTIFKAAIEKLRKEFDDVDISLEKANSEEKGYYRHLRFHVYASPPRGHEMELVDGGDTDWTQKLLNNAKERLVTSGIGAERLCERLYQSGDLAEISARRFTTYSTEDFPCIHSMNEQSIHCCLLHVESPEAQKQAQDS